MVFIATELHKNFSPLFRKTLDPVFRENLIKREYFAQFGIADGLRRLAEDHPFRPFTTAGTIPSNPQGVTA